MPASGGNGKRVLPNGWRGGFWILPPGAQADAGVRVRVADSGSTRLSEIVHALQLQLQLSRLGPQGTEEMIVAVDAGDLNRDGSERSEHRCRVRDGNTGDIVGGHLLLTVVARDVVTGRPWPLLTHLLSSVLGGFHGALGLRGGYRFTKQGFQAERVQAGVLRCCRT